MAFCSCCGAREGECACSCSDTALIPDQPISGIDAANVAQATVEAHEIEDHGEDEEPEGGEVAVAAIEGMRDVATAAIGGMEEMHRQEEETERTEAVAEMVEAVAESAPEEPEPEGEPEPTPDVEEEDEPEPEPEAEPEAEGEPAGEAEQVSIPPQLEEHNAGRRTAPTGPRRVSKFRARRAHR